MRCERVVGVCLAALGVVSAFQAKAAEPYQEYNKRIESAQTITALTDELMGDSVSLYNGATEFTATDISLPGNNSLPVQLSRRFSISLLVGDPGNSPGNPNYRGAGNWDIDVPYIATTWAQGTWPDARCSAPTYPTPTAPLTPLDVWHGNSVHIPGAGDRKLLMLLAGAIPQPTDGTAREWTTRERDMVRCIPMKSGLSGEGFLLQTASGLKYYFDVATTRSAGHMSVIWSDQATITVGRSQYYLLASRVEDRFGNWVEYDYNSAGHPDTITSSDGRAITLVYSGGRLSTATANGRTWTYTYGTSGSDSGMLVSVA